MIKSRFHFFRFYFALFIGTIFFLGMGSLLFGIFIWEIHDTSNIFVLIARIIIAAAFIATGFYLPLSYFRQVPVIRIDEGKISFSVWGVGKTYYIRDIEDVRQDTKVPLKFFVSHKLPGTRLKFKDGDVHYIYRDLYANSWKINCWIEDVLVLRRNLRDFGEPQRYAKIHPDEPLKKIEDSGVFNFWGLSLLAIGAILLYLFLIRPTTAITLPQFAVLATLLTGLSLLFNQLLQGFALSSKYLQIRKPIGRIAPNYFKLSEIREVRIEDPNSSTSFSQVRLPYALCVVTQNHKSYRYFAASLRKKDWKAFHARLKQAGVRVKVDAKGLL